jgi:hypothetical protein
MRHLNMADLASQPTDLADDTPDTPDTPVTEEIAATEMEGAADDPVDATTEANEPGPATTDGGETGNDDLLSELARAMHAAATSQYERMNAELERLRTEQVEAIAARSASEAEDLKSSNETDIGAIDAWAKAEAEKIKRERLRRIDARREQLAAELGRQETIRQREVFAIEVAIDSHRTEVDQFFGRMERETDPTAIARVAASLPPLPSLAEIAEAARRAAAGEFEAIAADAGATPAPEPTIAATPAETPSDADVTESRLMAVMHPDASHGGGPVGAPWEPPYAVSVAAGSGAAGAAGATEDTGAAEAVEPEAHGRVGSTLLRTVRAIRPMAASDKEDAPR